jgi:hypothetical protein
MKVGRFYFDRVGVKYKDFHCSLQRVGVMKIQLTSDRTNREVSTRLLGFEVWRFFMPKCEQHHKSEPA